MSLFAFNISLREAQDIKISLKNTSIISIREENDKNPLLLECEKLFPSFLTVRFTDLTYSNSETVNDKQFNAISKEDAANIVKFICENYNSNFIVHCHAGVSRSAAVCLFINRIFGHELKNNFWKLSEPNPLVVGRLFIEYHKMSDAIENKNGMWKSIT